MACTPGIQAQYALCHTGTLRFCFLVNLLDYWYHLKKVWVKYSFLWKVLLLQYKHYTAAIKSNIIYFETEVKTSTALNHRKKNNLCSLFERKIPHYSLLPQIYDFPTSHIDHLKGRIIIVTNRVAKCFSKKELWSQHAYRDVQEDPATKGTTQ